MHSDDSKISVFLSSAKCCCRIKNAVHFSWSWFDHRLWNAFPRMQTKVSILVRPLRVEQLLKNAPRNLWDWSTVLLCCRVPLSTQRSSYTLNGGHWRRLIFCGERTQEVHGRWDFICFPLVATCFRCKRGSEGRCRMIAPSSRQQSRNNSHHGHAVCAFVRCKLPNYPGSHRDSTSQECGKQKNEGAFLLHLRKECNKSWLINSISTGIM